VKHPELDPVGVDLESTLAGGINLVVAFRLETFSLERVGFATLLCVSTSLEEMRIGLAWSYFDVRNCSCKAPIRST
jgi:hypothetical protein